MAANFVDDRAGPGARVLPERYRVQAALGSGAQGETFAVVDAHDGAERVLKLFAPGAAGQGSALAEFRSLESLDHPTIVRVRDIGRTGDGRLYLVTDRVVGSPLDRLTAIADEEQRRQTFARVALDLTTALAHLHARGIMHGDVTPANVRLADDGPAGWRAVLIDFGLAGPFLAGGSGARGTLGYAAPEALTGARTPATDLFGLGATLFEAWSGAPPFGHGLAAAQRTLAGPPPALSTVRAGLGVGWDRLLDGLLAGDPGDRPAGARVVLREIARLSGGIADAGAELEVPYPDGDPLAGVFVGRRAERRALRAALEALGDGSPTHAVVALVGAPGSGRRALFEAVARDV
ncbi:MAG TPA: serine/threonine-protein kinase, partial [Polyangia bacterium]|nr:serine/threonine-protein kinase [Polyangia bacterium]